MKKILKNQKFITILTSIVLIIACTVPMALNPNWNGDNVSYMRQYELMADSLLKGRLDLDIDVDPKLAEMSNPYDPRERERLGVDFAWDHAFYNGHYYMYFGVVPALLVFAPFQALFNQPLKAYVATQLFVALIIAGIFTLFWFLRKKYFKNLSFLSFLFLASSISVMSVWYSVAAPALYATAITSAIAFEIWSIYCFFHSINNKEEGKKYLLWLLLGTLLGAFSFGCRPTIALFNIVLLPFLWQIIKTEKKINTKFILKLLATLLPYVVFGILLMLYNYARFGSPFEFGQSYQLTIADQTGYSSWNINPISIFNGTGEFFLRFDGLSSSFPFIQFCGLIWEYPLILLTIFGFSRSEVRKKLGELKPFIYTALIGVFVVVASMVLWSPIMLERYHMDVLFILGIISFITIASWNKLSNKTIIAFSTLTIIMCGLLFFVRPL
jgi:hypothetical protein